MRRSASLACVPDAVIVAPARASALEIYQKIPLRLVEVALSEALALSDQCGIYAYDAYFLAAARSPLDVEGIDLNLTKDEIVAFVREGRREFGPRA